MPALSKPVAALLVLLGLALMGASLVAYLHLQDADRPNAMGVGVVVLLLVLGVFVLGLARLGRGWQPRLPPRTWLGRFLSALLGFAFLGASILVGAHIQDPDSAWIVFLLICPAILFIALGYRFK